MSNRVGVFLSRSALNGVLLVVPPVLALAILYWLFTTLEEYARPVLLWVIPESWYLPGAGTLAVLALILLIGMLARNSILNRLLEWLQRGLESLPLLGPLYRSLRDLSRLVAADEGDKSGSKPVQVSFPEMDLRMLGLELPRTIAQRLPDVGDEQTLVYLPMTYQIGGFMVVVPRQWVQPLPMTSVEALQFIIGGGMGHARSMSASTTVNGKAASTDDAVKK